MNVPLVVLVGETGSGKTALAIKLAQAYKGEIISADSRTLYRHMDIGTAKPTIAERQGVPHYGFDLIEPGEHFSAYQFQQHALRWIDEIASRGKLPIMVGGTGLYIDAVLFGYRFRPLPNQGLRQVLSTLSVAELQRRVKNTGLPLPANEQNPRHLIRLLESGLPPVQPQILRPHTLVLGLSAPRDALRERLARRVASMLEQGLVEEARQLYARYGNTEALRTPGYRAMVAYIDGTCTLDQAVQQFVRDDLALAKRQRTWFRRNEHITWLPYETRGQKAQELVEQFLANA